MAEQERTVTHQEDRKRFIITVDGEEAGYATYVERDGVRDFNHTVVDPKFRGQGLSSPLIKTALDETRERGFSIIPSCSAVEHFVHKYEDYQDLLAR